MEGRLFLDVVGADRTVVFQQLLLANTKRCSCGGMPSFSWILRLTSAIMSFDSTSRGKLSPFGVLTKIFMGC